ncbi:MAG: hypothetical protein R6V11_06510 [Ectothiorhodospiraceae bacterium]
MTRVLGNTALIDASRLLRLALPQTPPPEPGQWLTIRTNDGPLTVAVLDTSPDEGWLAVRVPAVFADWSRGTECATDGPFGEPIRTPPGERQLVLLADAAGLPAVLFAARCLPVHLALIGLDDGPAPFRLRPSRFMIEGVAPEAIAAIGALEDAGVASRVAHPEPLPGCREGDLAALAGEWLAQRSASERWQTAVAVVGTAATTAELKPLLRGAVGEHQERLIPD